MATRSYSEDGRSLSSNPRASLRSWLRYEPYISAAFQAYPQPYRFRVEGLAPSTFISRVRDAVRGCLFFSHPCDILPAKLREWWGWVEVRTDGQDIVIGPRDRALRELEPVVPVTQTIESTEYLEVTEAERDAFALLLNSGRLPSPIILSKVWPDWDPGYLNVMVVIQNGQTHLV